MEVDIMALGNVMSVQAQPNVQTTVQTKPVVQMERSTGDTNATVSVQEAQKVDKTMRVVQDAQAKGNSEQRSEQQPSNEQIRKAVEQMNKNMTNSEAVFGIHDGTNRVTIKIIDKDTKEVIKELPPEKTLDMIAKVWEMAGILVDERR